METIIYKSYSEFLKRENKETNGVSELFSQKHPNFKDQNKSNKGCWNCSRCSYCSYCYDCSDCSDCSRCSYCSYCYDCSRCSDNKTSNHLNKIPKVENIHQSILKACSIKGALDMSDRHTCETTHCRAGWVTTLAGVEGKELEEKTSTLFAAMQIYKKSSPIKVSPVRFFESNEVAMKDINRCDQLEANQD